MAPPGGGLGTVEPGAGAPGTCPPGVPPEGGVAPVAGGEGSPLGGMVPPGAGCAGAVCAYTAREGTNGNSRVGQTNRCFGFMRSFTGAGSGAPPRSWGIDLGARRTSFALALGTRAAV